MSKGPNRQYTRQEVVDIMRGHDDPREPWTSTEIADELGCSRELAYNRLRELHSLGLVNTKKISSRGRVFWLAPEGSVDTDGTAASVANSEPSVSTN